LARRRDQRSAQGAQQSIRDNAVVKKLDGFKPEDSIDLERIARAFSDAPAELFVHTAPSHGAEPKTLNPTEVSAFWSPTPWDSTALWNRPMVTPEKFSQQGDEPPKGLGVHGASVAPNAANFDGVNGFGEYVQVTVD